jgi:hypothetical protein
MCEQRELNLFASVEAEHRGAKREGDQGACLSVGCCLC